MGKSAPSNTAKGTSSGGANSDSSNTGGNTPSNKDKSEPPHPPPPPGNDLADGPPIDYSYLSTPKTPLRDLIMERLGSGKEILTDMLAKVEELLDVGKGGKAKTTGNGFGDELLYERTVSQAKETARRMTERKQYPSGRFGPLDLELEEVSVLKLLRLEDEIRALLYGEPTWAPGQTELKAVRNFEEYSSEALFKLLPDVLGTGYGSSTALEDRMRSLNVRD